MSGVEDASQTESVGKLHRFCQTPNSPFSHVPSTLVISNDCSTQTTDFTRIDPTPVPVLDLTKDTDALPTATISPPSQVPPDFVIVQGENDPLSNFYQFSFRYNNVDYNGLEQAYQHIRAVKAKKSALADSILKALSPREAKSLSKRLSRPDREFDIGLMRQLLRAKAEQCASFRSALTNSGNVKLIHSTHPSDRFWGSGLFPHQTPDSSRTLPGNNHFGALLMELCPVIDSVMYTPTSAVDYVDHGVVVVMLQDGEKPTKSIHRSQRSLPSKPSGPHHSSSRQSFCLHCGIRGHVARICRLKNTEVKCFKCCNIGHKQRYCPFVSNTVDFHHSNLPTRVNRVPILPTPAFNTFSSNYAQNFPPLAPHSQSHPNFH